MHTFHCGFLVQLCSCICCKQKKVDCIDYYTEEENKLFVKIEESIERKLKKPMGILFITFENQKMAELFLRHYDFGLLTHLFHRLFGKKKSSMNCFLCKQMPKESSVSYQIRSAEWFASDAPAPSNIIWLNLSKSKSHIVWWLKVIVINIVLFVLVIFFTSPSIIIEKLAQPFVSNSSYMVSYTNYAKGFVPTLFLRLLQGLLPVCGFYYYRIIKTVGI